MKRIISLVLTLLLLLAMTACASEGQPESSPALSAGAQETLQPPETNSLAGTTIEVATRQENDSLEAYKAVIADFEAETGVKVQLTEYSSSDYESTMKTRMASGELPDVFETHGWSRLRYGEYLYPVNDEPWYEEMTELSKGILTGPGDTAYALMGSCSILGVVCNKTACDAVGIDVYAIDTWADFADACQTAIDAGLVPIVNHNSAGDLTHVAGIFTTYEDGMTQNAQAQLDGTWDWADNMLELEYFGDLINRGAYWKDRSTMDSAADIERMASGDSLFYIANGATYIVKLLDQNPDSEFVIIPFPAASEGAGRYFAGGEGFCVGIYNETKELEACRAYLSYLAERAGDFAMVGYSVKGLENMKVPDSISVTAVADAMERFDNTVYVNMWDREYMPNGMWNVYGEAVGMLYADASEENLSKINQFLKDNYIEKYAAAQEG